VKNWGLKGALNPDMSRHRRCSEHKNGSTKEVTRSDITLLQEISRLLKELIELKAPKKVYVGE